MYCLLTKNRIIFLENRVLVNLKMIEGNYYASQEEMISEKGKGGDARQ